jgi:hypothetical protein
MFESVLGFSFVVFLWKGWTRGSERSVFGLVYGLLLGTHTRNVIFLLDTCVTIKAFVILCILR